MNNVTTLPRLRSHEAPPPGYVSGMDLAVAAGITYRQLDFWTRSGLLHPETKPTPGSGYLRAYPLHELHVATLVRELLDGGLALRPAFTHARRLLDTGTTRIAGFTVHLPEEH